MEYEEIMKMILTELTERSYQRQRDENAEFNSLIKKRLELSRQVFSYTEGLEDTTKQLLKDYYEIIDIIHGFQIEYIYLQGAKDCVMLLKTLEVI